MAEVLNFLSNDKYSFIFVPLTDDRPNQQQYFQFGELDDWPFYAPERVIMFSGGLDSLAGTVETARAGGQLVLVSHRPVSTLYARQRSLFNQLRMRFPGQLIHVPVWINKDERFGQEPTQRTRSFLYSSLGTVIAESVKAGGVRFFENGVVSLNLPVADEVLRARASRTTHPLAFHLLQSLFTAVTERDFAIDNPYIFKTKTDVATIIASNDAADLIPLTCSCAHMMFKPKSQWHCGTCSQCIDRRFATVAAGLLAYDLDTDYVSDVFVGLRKDGPEKNMAVDYARHGIELCQRSEPELAGRFNAEISRAVRYEANRSEAADKIISMHKRHGEVVTRVLEQKIREHAPQLVAGTLDDSSLLALVIGKKHLAAESSAEIPIETAASSSTLSENLASMKMQELLAAFLARLPVAASERERKKRKPEKLKKRDTVIFAANLKELKGLKYCAFLDGHNIKPAWSEDGHSTYSKGYKAGEPWQKKIQDEKSRAKARMSRYADSELAEAVNRYLPDEFHSIVQVLNSRNSPSASKLSRRSGPA